MIDGDDDKGQPDHGAAPRPYRPGRWRRPENAVMSVLVGAGLVPRSSMLTTVGRRTGQLRRNPVVLVDHDERRWLVAPYGALSWVHNARAAGTVEIAQCRAPRTYAIREVAGHEAGPVLKRYVHLASATRQCFRADRRDPLEAFVAEAAQQPVFELTPHDDALAPRWGAGPADR